MTGFAIPARRLRWRGRRPALHAATLSLLLAACAGGTPAGELAPAPVAGVPASPPASSSTLAGVESRLDWMLSSASTCAADAECRTVAVGGKACGGPAGYRAYSSLHADPAAVEALAQQERQLATDAERAAHRVSNCMVMADPGARCVAHRCALGALGAMPAGGTSTR